MTNSRINELLTELRCECEQESRMEHAQAIKEAVVLIAQCDPDPPPNSVKARIAFVVDRLGAWSARGGWTTGPAQACAEYRDWSQAKPLHTGTIIAHLPRPQLVEVKGEVEVQP